MKRFQHHLIGISERND